MVHKYQSCSFCYINDCTADTSPLVLLFASGCREADDVRRVDVRPPPYWRQGGSDFPQADQDCGRRPTLDAVWPLNQHTDAHYNCCRLQNSVTVAECENSCYSNGSQWIVYRTWNIRTHEIIYDLCSVLIELLITIYYEQNTVYLTCPFVKKIICYRFLFGNKIDHYCWFGCCKTAMPLCHGWPRRKDSLFQISSTGFLQFWFLTFLGMSPIIQLIVIAVVHLLILEWLAIYGAQFKLTWDVAQLRLQPLYSAHNSSSAKERFATSTVRYWVRIIFNSLLNLVRIILFTRDLYFHLFRFIQEKQIYFLTLGVKMHFSFFEKCIFFIFHNCFLVFISCSVNCLELCSLSCVSYLSTPSK